jgi:hypothetical protein
VSYLLSGRSKGGAKQESFFFSFLARFSCDSLLVSIMFWNGCECRRQYTGLDFDVVGSSGHSFELVLTFFAEVGDMAQQSQVVFQADGL